MKPGDSVGFGKWVGVHRDPAHWVKPGRGVLLSPDAPLAWVGTHAFPEMPTPAQVTEHLRKANESLRGRGLTPVGVATVPVLCGNTVIWESVSRVLPYSQELAHWERARARALILCGLLPFSGSG